MKKAIVLLSVSFTIILAGAVPGRAVCAAFDANGKPFTGPCCDVFVNGEPAQPECKNHANDDVTEDSVQPSAGTGIAVPASLSILLFGGGLMLGRRLPRKPSPPVA